MRKHLRGNAVLRHPGRSGNDPLTRPGICSLDQSFRHSTLEPILRSLCLCGLPICAACVLLIWKVVNKFPQHKGFSWRSSWLSQAMSSVSFCYSILHHQKIISLVMPDCPSERSRQASLPQWHATSTLAMASRWLYCILALSQQTCSQVCRKQLVMNGG